MAMMLSVASAFLPVLFFSVSLANTKNDFLEVYIISFAQAMRGCASNLAEMGSMSFFSLCCQCTVNTLRVAVIQDTCSLNVLLQTKHEQLSVLGDF